MHDQDEHVQIESEHRGNYVYPAPGPSHAATVTRNDRGQQYQQRYGADYIGWLEPVKWKHKPGGAGRNREDQKGRCPAIESLRGQQPGGDDESRENSNQTDRYVKEGECS